LLAAIGITNQRESTVVWDKETGQPLHNAISKPAADRIVQSKTDHAIVKALTATCSFYSL
jgi:glycerol kinase